MDHSCGLSPVARRWHSAGWGKLITQESGTSSANPARCVPSCCPPSTGHVCLSCPSMYYSNLTSVIPPFSFIPIVHGQILSSPQPNLPHVSTQIGSSPSPWPSRSSATGSAEVHTCLQRAAAKYSRAGERRFCRGPACQQKVGIVERHGRPATRSHVARVERNFCLVYVLIRRNCASVNVGSPLSPTPAKLNSIKKARNLSNHALRSVCRPSYASLLDRGRHIRIQRHVR